MLEELTKNAYGIEWNKNTNGPAARVLIEGKPTSAFICLIKPIQEDKQPNFLTVEQWQLAKALQKAEDNK